MTEKMGVLTIRVLEDMFAPLLQKCVEMVRLKKIHAQIFKFSLSQSSFLATKMVDICDQNGEVEYAILLFNQVVEPNSFLYNAMIRAYTHSHLYTSTINVYKHMLTDPQDRDPVFPDKFTYPSVIKSCGGLLCLHLGKQVHGHTCKFGFKSNTVIENSLLDMYVKCENLRDAHKLFEEMTTRDVISWNNLITGHIKLGQLKRARALFEEMPSKTIVSWTAMISGYTRVGCYADALDVFRRMQMEGVKPDWVSLIAILSACAKLGALELGKWIHFFAERNGYLQETCVCNALIEMYAKCGCVGQAWQLFDKMPERDVISWGTMIGGLANHGKAREAIELFQEMQRAKIVPNQITYVGLLSACAHAGFLDEGLTYFESMRKDYGLAPGIEHYGCLVDLLGRTGCLYRALELIKNMPIKPDSAIWGSLLSSCRTHCNLEVAVVAMEHLLELEPDDTGNYVLLSNIYARVGRWDGVSRIRKLIRSKSMKKTPGCSLIEVNSVVKEFRSGDDSKLYSEQIYWVLELLAWNQSTSRNSIIESESML
ncbi:pentatricopeptide repeat-containing protein At2g20540 [Diospyros lotus]|uniref:pentatricopeptide repeat-containing protein At2g20540 n=1 Tax=Diospyros lotus TaxID=55363 RepID=UPI0022562CD9|nr:pentatricopeptide repeat-containing protein At2g20540 [Diospyros lotus]